MKITQRRVFKEWRGRVYVQKMYTTIQVTKRNPEDEKIMEANRNSVAAVGIHGNIVKVSEARHGNRRHCDGSTLDGVASKRVDQWS